VVEALVGRADAAGQSRHPADGEIAPPHAFHVGGDALQQIAQQGGAAALPAGAGAVVGIPVAAAASLPRMRAMFQSMTKSPVTTMVPLPFASALMASS